MFTSLPVPPKEWLTENGCGNGYYGIDGGEDAARQRYAYEMNVGREFVGRDECDLQWGYTGTKAQLVGIEHYAGASVRGALLAKPISLSAKRKPVAVKSSCPVEAVRAARRARERAQAAYLSAVRAARAAGVSVADVADAAGVTRQRVYQLASS